MTPKHQLDLRSRHPNFQTFLDINERESKKIRDNYTCFLDVPYGNEPLQTLDIFPSSIPNSPILIFIHGGYWKGLDKLSYSFIAEPYIKNNITTCIVNYQLIPTVTMESLLNDITTAIQWIISKATMYNGNSNKIILSGHSAGGHLAVLSYLLTENIQPKIQAICSLSGIFNLAPIQHSYLNDILQLNTTDVHKFSVSNKDLSRIKCPLLLSVGGNETDLFIEESKNLYLEHKEVAPITYYEYADLNHYEIVHKLGQDYNLLSEFICATAVQ
ncbi:alpha/beta hydrolase [Tenacibaculum amylolyticum]|uniref:alpha/beta hydrolase n=1 Tax=Tenacibaculum amylolyticum TaxID=104269 RepID=UPI003894CF8E